MTSDPCYHGSDCAECSGWPSLDDDDAGKP